MGNKTLKIIDRFSNVQETSKPSKGATTRSQQIDIRRVQNVLLIWLDQNIDRNNTDCCNIISQFQQIVNDINIFTDGDKCVQFIENVIDTKVCIVVSDSLDQHIMSRIHNLVQVDSIFIFYNNQQYHKQWGKDWFKIRGIFSEISSICDSLKQAVQQCEHNAVSISFIPTGGVNIYKKNLDQIDPNFIYSEILKEILLTTEFENEHLQEYINYCYTVFADNDIQLNKVDKLRLEYGMKTPIWWYNWKSFLYPMLSRSLRLMDMSILIKMGFFIKDLHQHIEQLHREQFTGNKSRKIFTVYRGQSISKTDFNQMKNTQGGLISFNSFLSTHKDRQVSLRFAHHTVLNIDMIGVLFVITIDPVKSTTTPFASIADVEYFDTQEDEILFTLHTTFRIDEIIPMNENSSLFQINLTLVYDNDKDLLVLTDRIRKEICPNDKQWDRLSSLLLRKGESAKAQQIYEILLEQTTDEDERAGIYYQLGITKDDQGDYQESITFYEKTLEIYEKTLPTATLNLACCYNNIGVVYEKMIDYRRALLFHRKAFKIRKRLLPSNHPDLASSYHNIGNVYFNMDDQPKALLYYRKALVIDRRTLPSNHPHLAGSYNNIGNVYSKMGNYIKALSSYEKALDIQKQSVPSKHPDLAKYYNNIGNVHSKTGDYSKALSYYEKALEIRQQSSLPANHSDLAYSYNNIGEVYRNIGDYLKALSFHEKALEIRNQSLPSNHPHLAKTYNNIASVYDVMGDYEKAYSFSEQAIKFTQHPHLRFYKKNFKAIKRKL